MKNVNWPHVGLAAVAVGGLLGTLALILALTPESLLDRMVEVNWPAAIMGAVSLAISVVVMLRRAGLWKDGPPPGGTLLALLGVLALGGTLAGCGASPYDAARVTLATSARVMAAVDRDLAEQRIATAEEIAADPASTREEYRAAMAPYDETLLASTDARDFALLAQSAIDAAERGEASDWMGMLGCTAVAASRLVAIADRRGIRLPPDARTLAELIVGAGATACSAPSLSTGGAR